MPQGFFLSLPEATTGAQLLPVTLAAQDLGLENPPVTRPDLPEVEPLLGIVPQPAHQVLLEGNFRLAERAHVSAPRDVPGLLAHFNELTSLALEQDHDAEIRLTEAKLAREAEICYGVIALSTDYDCWHETHEDVTVEAILEIMHKNVVMSKAIIRQLTHDSTLLEQSCCCGSTLASAIITDRSVIPAATVAKLGPIVSKYLN